VIAVTERGRHFLDVPHVGLDDRIDDGVLGLVVVDVPPGNIRRLGNVGEGGLLDSLAMQQVGRVSEQPLPLARSRVHRICRSAVG
jgi:hypothetical protein